MKNSSNEMFNPRAAFLLLVASFLVSEISSYSVIHEPDNRDLVLHWAPLNACIVPHPWRPKTILDYYFVLFIESYTPIKEQSDVPADGPENDLLLPRKKKDGILGHTVQIYAIRFRLNESFPTRQSVLDALPNVPGIDKKANEYDFKNPDKPGKKTFVYQFGTQLRSLSSQVHKINYFAKRIAKWDISGANIPIANSLKYTLQNRDNETNDYIDPNLVELHL